jgi:hypothetical protein
MKKILLGVALTVVVATACVAKSKNSQVVGRFEITPDYTELNVSTGIRLVLVDPEVGRGTITADDKAFDRVKIVRNGNRVSVFHRPLFHWFSSFHPTVVEMPLSPFLNDIEASSAATVSSKETIVLNRFEIEASSAAEVVLNIEAQKVDVGLSSAATCKLTGTVDRLEVETSSGADFDGSDLIGRLADVEASSGSSMEIYVTERLEAEASSGGHIRYTGGSRVLRETSSGGSIRELR